MLTDIRGLLRDPHVEDTLIHVLHTYDVPELVAGGVISGDMLPKMECCVDAISGGVERVHILDGRIPHFILIELLSDKGIAGGLPMSGIMADEKCRSVLGSGSHATTFDANPVCVAAGLLVQETLTDDFLKEVQAKGDYLRSAIEALDLPCFGKTRGMGLMIGIAVSDGYNKSEIASRLIESGLLVLTARPGMRLLPPLSITKEEMDQGLAIMAKTLKAC